jgi:hypothetical protein
MWRHFGLNCLVLDKCQGVLTSEFAESTLEYAISNIYLVLVRPLYSTVLDSTVQYSSVQ